MVYVVNDFSRESLANLLKEIKRKNKKDTLVEHFGCLKRGIDGLEYQKAIRNEWS